MKSVVDTNILISFFRESPVKYIIINQALFDLELYSPKYALEELWNNKLDLLKYSKLSNAELESKFNELQRYIKFLPPHLLKSFEDKAKQISPHDKDIPFFALALKLNCFIWSNEPAFKKQSKVKVLNTKELIEEFSELSE